MVRSFSKVFDPKLTTNSASDTFCGGDTGEDCESATVEDVLGTYILSHWKVTSLRLKFIQQ